MYKCIIAAIASLFLVACGGGGSSSGSGGSGQPIANIDRFVGNYSGTVTQRLTSSVGSGTGTFPVVGSIGPGGLLSVRFTGNTTVIAQCNFAPVVLSENPLSYTRSGQCTVSGAANTCQGREVGTARVSGQTVTATTRTDIECAEGVGTFTSEFRLTRT